MKTLINIQNRTYLLFCTINSRRILYMPPKSPLISRIKRNKKEAGNNKKNEKFHPSLPTNHTLCYHLLLYIYLMFLNERLVFIFLSISETLGIIIGLQLRSIINDFFWLEFFPIAIILSAGKRSRAFKEIIYSLPVISKSVWWLKTT